MLMHSTLEEAWGKHRLNLVKKKNSKQCDLYEGRKAKVKKPYKKNGKRSEYRNMMLLNDEDYENGMLKPDLEKYHGYTDSRAFSRSSSRNRAPAQRKVKVNPAVNTYAEDVDQDIVSDDESEVEEEIPSSEYIFEEVYEEDDDNYLTEKFKRKDSHRKQVVDEEVLEEQVEDVSLVSPKSLRLSKDVHADMNQVLDLSIYTLSGILLIVILEQFVQLGVKIKSFN